MTASRTTLIHTLRLDYHGEKKQHVDQREDNSSKTKFSKNSFCENQGSLPGKNMVD